MSRGPLREYYLRNNKNAPLEGPYTLYEAEYKARVGTREAARTGIGDNVVELVTSVGTREGDPTGYPSIFVMFIYINGRKTIGGELAQYHSRKSYT